MYQVIDKNILPFDVDGTLIYNKRKIEPGSYYTFETVEIEYGETRAWFDVHQEHLDLLKHHKNTGRFSILVWSANGKEWAETVVKALGIEKYVDFIATKPSEYVDDKDCTKWMGTQIWLEDVKKA